MRSFARLRWIIARHPALYWLAVLTCAVALAAPIFGAQQQVTAERDSWGDTAAVIIATRPINPGEPLAAATTGDDYPQAMIPPSAIATLDPDASARRAIDAGEVLVAGDLSVASGPRALLPPDWVGITIDRAQADIFTLGDGAVIYAAAQQLTGDGIVIAVGDGYLVVGVEPHAADDVAYAVSQGIATVGLSANPPPTPTAQTLRAQPGR